MIAFLQSQTTREDHDHSPEAIRDRLAAGPTHSYLRDWVYGGIDGAVTTLAVVTGVAGASLPAQIIVILGFANLVADGFSMAASNYSGTRTEHEEFERVKAIEHQHIRLYPAGEREEIRQIYAKKGFSGVDLERIVQVVTSDEDRWVRTMLSEEWGLPQEIRSPWLAAFSTMSAFVICGVIALIPFLLGIANALLFSIGATAVAFFAIGSAKSRWSLVPWWRSGLETLAIGAAAAALAFAVGAALRGLAS